MESNKTRILLVDDSELVLNMLSQYLEQEGFEVITAANGLEGILTTYQYIPDVIIMDVEMPRLQGYQASRLLKNKREVNKIPIIMHTTLTEDKDKFWALTSGVEEFVTKDFDNLEKLKEAIQCHAKSEKPDNDIVKEDSQKVTEAAIMEMLGRHFDTELFRSTVQNKLGDVARHIGSLSLTTHEIMKLVGNVCENHITVILVNYKKQVQSYVYPSEKIYKRDVKDFLGICYGEFKDKFPDAELKGIKEVVFNIQDRDDYERVSTEGRKINSYICFPLRGKGEGIIGTIHIGNRTNNYFSEVITENIKVFVKSAGIVMENALLFNAVNEMEHRVRNVFSKFVPPEIIKDLIEQHSTSNLQIGESRNVAIVFADIRDFTPISENNNAEAIVSFLNEYFRTMGGVIKQHGGVIDKFIGDAILAVFGAPRSYENNSERAVRAAIDMLDAVKNVNISHLHMENKKLRIGIGVNEGKAIVGNIGSKDKFDYTVIGDNVNLTSRIEGLTKYYHRSLILSDTVFSQVEGVFPIREVDTVKVKGREKTTELYSVILPEEGRLDAKSLKEYKKAIRMYKMRNWNIALGYFRKIAEQYPSDTLTKLYIERCERFLKNPPPETWDGATVFDFK